MNTAFRKLLASSTVQRADLLLVSGDVTDRGDLASWEVFSSACTDACVAHKLLVLPGNHDVCCLGARLPGKRQAYRRQDLARVRKGLRLAMQASTVALDETCSVGRFPLVATPDPRLVVFCLNSNFLGNLNVVSNAMGAVDYFQLLSLASKLHKYRAVPVKIIAFHHSPNIPTRATARRRGQRAFSTLERLGHQITPEQRQALRLLCVSHRVRLLVHGHLHLAEDRRVTGIRIIGAPASTQPIIHTNGAAQHQLYTYTIDRPGRYVRVKLRTIEP